MSSIWSNRDAAIVPWINLRNSADDGTYATIGTHRDASAPPDHAPNASHRDTHQAAAAAAAAGGRYARSCKILSLLSTRERVGSKGQCGRAGLLSEGVAVTNDGLARAGAWNPRRLQNMTLAIGPGTPAACVILADPSSSSEEEDDDDDEEDEENLGAGALGEVDSDENEVEAAAEEQKMQDQECNTVESVKDSETDEAMELIEDAEEGQEYHFDDSGRLVKDNEDDASGRARQEAETEISRHLSACITQSPAGNEQEDEDDEQHEEDDEDEEEDQPGRSTGRRSRWEKRQQSILDALNGVGNEESESDGRDTDDNMGDSGDSFHTDIENGNGGADLNDNSSHQSVESNDSAGLTARDRYNIRQVEQYIDHLETLHRRRERRANQALSSPARDQGVFNNFTQMYEREVARSMKHDGCINTVSWLDCGWRISTVSHEDAHPYSHYYNDGFISSSSSYSSNNYSPQSSNYSTPPRQKPRHGGLVAPLEPTEYPTQLLTSGDDHTVKLWDVGQSMGSTSPLPGGSATINPFSSPRMPMRACSELVDTWKNHGGGYSSSTVGSHRRYLPGIVHPLVTLTTGHSGNVFHASPVPHSLGKIATCAADGYLRLMDVEVHSAWNHTNNRGRSNSTASSSSHTGDSSAVIISPEYQSENGESEPVFRFHNSLMCFSHHFLSANVGLVCSERGLLHFDLRLPARSQKRGSLVPELSTTCKSCFPWRLGCSDGDENELESAYVFAGGTGVDVGLYDLRMTGSSSGGSSQVVQKYRPRALRNKSSSVAVSGIDLSKDKQELLVSYESDQVYTFPIKCPTLSDIDGGDTKTDKHVPELAAYGGHLNRLTFLKMAKYAGPNDEYICTGSDSGHAWIYEKSSGCVVSFIKADNSTCNGIQPHPTLPFFITYGIDSTAKLWRATTPVDNDVDDSDLGRFNYSKRVKYEKSVVADQWKKARKGKEIDLDDEELSFFPDETNEDDDVDPDHFLGVFIRSRFSQDTPFIGNDLMNLNNTLAKNYFTCVRSIGMDDDEPVKSGVAAMKSRVSLIKLRYQADRLGLEFNSRTPWILKPKDHLQRLTDEGKSDGDMVSYGCLADLIPDFPSDFIPFDKLLANHPRPGGMQFNTKYEKYYLESSADRSVTPVSRAHPIKVGEDGTEGDEMEDAAILDKLDHEASKQPHSMQSNEKLAKSCEHSYDSAKAWDILFQTVSLLKEAGNQALKASLPFLAARRYDKAINYCSLAYLEFPVGNVDFLVEHQYVVSKNSGYECRWNELLKTLIMIRLNLAMCFLKEEINDTKGAITQANLSLKELRPFATERGIVLTGKKLAKKRTDEPHETYTEAKSLQAKAYFRLGSAQLAMDEYDDALKSLEHCVDSTREAGLTVDAGIMRKINETKRCRKEKKERQRKKFKFMFSSRKDDDETKDNDEVDG
ncbi:hypothetical protein ACHAXR_007459 [Thalassiosira sp. AJA248-18]